MAQATKGGYEVALNAITDLTGIPQEQVRITGGGKGWKATVEYSGLTFIGANTSKAGAAEDLLAQMQAFAAQQEPDDHGAALAGVDPDEAEGEAKERPTVEQALEALGAIFGEFDVEEEDDNRTPGPVWKGTTLVRVVPCVGECMMAHPNSPCDCRCDGANHAIGGAFMFPILTAAVASNDKAEFKAALAKARPIRLEPKPCLCGCGGETMRRFIPGHDARYHAAIKAGFANWPEHMVAKEAAALEKQTAKAQREQLAAQKREAKAASK